MIAMHEGRASQTMGSDPIWGHEIYFWGRETNGLDKSDTNIFVNSARKLHVGLQWIYF